MQTYDYAPPRVGAMKGESLPTKTPPKGKDGSIVQRARAKKKGRHCK